MNNCKKIILSFIAIVFLIGMSTTSNATNVDSDDLKNYLVTEAEIDINNITESDVITLYEELSKEYTNDELADIVENYSTELQQEGVDQETIDAGVTLLRTTDSEQLKQILEEDINIDEVKERLDRGEDLEQIITDMNINPVSVGAKLLLANTIFQTILVIAIIVGVYSIIVRWRIYSKANKHAWAAIIPIYRDVVWLKIAGITPWVLLLVLIPIIGWISLALIVIISKFTIAKEFGRSALFGLGLWILPIIFESIMAFSKNIEYVGDDNK